MLMVWLEGGCLADRFAAARAAVAEMFPRLPRAGKTYQGFIKAVLLKGAWLMDILVTRLREQMQKMSSCWRVLEVLAFAVDGSRLECPRTQANQDQLKRAGRSKTGPQLSLTTLYHMGSGCPWDYRIGAGVENERTHLRSMLSSLPRGATLVADAGFIGYDLLRETLAFGLHALFRVGSNVRLLRELGYFEMQDDSTVYLWPEKAQKNNQPPLVLRIIQLKTGRYPVVVVTDMMSQEALSDEQAGVLYRMRWGVEVFFRSLKQTLCRRKMRSGAPAQAKMELAWCLVGLWILSLLGAQAVVARGKKPLSLSIALALRKVRQAISGRMRPGSNLQNHLAKALKDNYNRTSSKAARDYPQKKKDPPTGAPKISSASIQQVQHAKELQNQIAAA
jgi:IS4 transposase